MRALTVITTVIVTIALRSGGDWGRAAPGSRGAPTLNRSRVAGSRTEKDGLHVIPFPATPDASTKTPIIFSSLAPSDLRSVTVTGSRSGMHPGRLSVLPDRAGTAFLSDHPFATGERVSVHAVLRSPAAGTASGALGATTIGFWFRTATPASGVTAAAAAGEPAQSSRYRATAAGRIPVAMKFHSQAFHPPALRVSGDDHSSGDIFLSPRPSYQRPVHFQHGPEIVNGHGRLVWFRNLGDEEANNMAVQTYNGEPVLTWWQGTPKGGHAQDMITDRSYHTVAIVKAAEGHRVDTHAFRITPRGTALLDAVVPEKADLRPEGGPANGTLDDCVIQEVDIKTGRLLWEWDALGHIPLSASYTKPSSTRPFDYFHLNSIQQLPGGDLLISARATWAVYRIRKRTGRVVWTLGGKDSSFRIGPRARFEWQHHARLIDKNLLSVFDNASDGRQKNESQSSGKVLKLNFSARTARLKHRYSHAPPVLSVSQGSVETLPGYNRFVGWGFAPEFSEYTPGGRQIFNGSFALGVQSYRAYLAPWRGRPTSPPAMANRPGPAGAVTVYASWNGATQISAWRVLGGPSPHALTVLDRRTPKQGFETTLDLHSEPRYFAVQALGANGNVLGTSQPHLDRPDLAVFTPDAFVSASGGRGQVPVGCFTGGECSVTLTVSSGTSVLARTAPVHISSGTGMRVGFRLSAAGRSRLDHAAGHRLTVQVSARGASGETSTTHMNLIPYSISGPPPPRDPGRSATIRIVDADSFVSSSGRGALLSACYASRPCSLRATISAGGRVIASGAPRHLGVDELGDVYFHLNAAGRARMANASGNQLGAQVKLTNRTDTATGQIDLIGYR